MRHIVAFISTYVYRFFLLDFSQENLVAAYFTLFMNSRVAVMRCNLQRRRIRGHAMCGRNLSKRQPASTFPISPLAPDLTSGGIGQIAWWRWTLTLQR